MSEFIQINYTSAGAPEPTTLALFGIGLLGTREVAEDGSTICAIPTRLEFRFGGFLFVGFADIPIIASARRPTLVNFEILDTYVPWEAERCQSIELTVKGRFPPTIRKPIVRLPSGRVGMGIGDAVVLNDPLTGQSSNNASKCARVVYDAILAHGDNESDEQWMQQTFDEYWDYVRCCASLTNTLLRPPIRSTKKLLKAPTDHQGRADLFANVFDNSRDYDPWFLMNAKPII